MHLTEHNGTGSEEAPSRLVSTIRRLYDAPRFKIGLIVFDVVVILSFLILTFVPDASWTVGFDMVLGALMLAELAGRIIAATRRVNCIVSISTLLDVAIIVSLFVPSLTGSFAFLRVFRAVRLFQSLNLKAPLRTRSSWFAANEEVLGNVANIGIFLLVTSAIVYEAQVYRNPDIRTFADALYFTVTTVTTTGFGDITLVGETGRLISIVVMLAGISLFVRLAQSVIRPGKVRHTCERCGLSRHDPDAVHCKHCGQVVHIPTEGA
jgi:voltage-gated potassium channel